MHGDPREDEHVANEGAWDDRVECAYAVRERSRCEAPDYEAALTIGEIEGERRARAGLSESEGSNIKEGTVEANETEIEP